MKNKLFEEFIIALSLANLLFIKSWRNVIYPSSEAYHIKLEAYQLDYLGVLLGVLFTAGLLFSGNFFLRYLNKGKTPLLSKFIFLSFFLVILNGIRLQFFESESSLFLKLGIFAAFFLIGIAVILKWREMVFGFTKSFLLVLSPFILFTFSQAFFGLFTADPQPEPTIGAQLANIQPKVKTNIKNRVIWIIFDELDFFVPFGSNPPLVNLPEFRKLKNESLFATNAVSPAYETINSIPSLLTGKKVTKTQTSGKSELLLKFGEEDWKRFSQTPNIFREVKEMNGETAVVGWYHSYCRVIGKDLSACQWESFDTINDFEPQPLSRIILRDLLNCMISLPFGFRIYDYARIKVEANIEDAGYAKRHLRTMESAKEVAANRNIDLAFIHLPFPHPPNLFNKTTGKIGTTNTTYLDNLVLSDLALGEIRQTLEDNNLWNNSTILVSSDHQWRLNSYQLSSSNADFQITNGVEHPNIPFFLKLKAQKESVVYEKPFNTIISHDLILALMKGEINKPEEVRKFIEGF